MKSKKKNKNGSSSKSKKKSLADSSSSFSTTLDQQAQQQPRQHRTTVKEQQSLHSYMVPRMHFHVGLKDIMVSLYHIYVFSINAIAVRTVVHRQIILFLPIMSCKSESLHRQRKENRLLVSRLVISLTVLAVFAWF
jgi:hypothetical protein